MRQQRYNSIHPQISPSQSRSKIHHSEKLQNDPDTGRIFSQPPLISFKRDKNIGNFLVRRENIGTQAIDQDH